MPLFFFCNKTAYFIRVILNCVLGKWFVPRTVPWKARFRETKKNYCVKEILSSMYLSKLQSLTRIVHRKNIPGFIKRGLPKRCYVLFN